MRGTALILVAVSLGRGLLGQEAERGLDVRLLIGGTGFASSERATGSEFNAGFRAVLYPTWKLSSHWTVSGVVQLRSHPYFTEDLVQPGYGAKTDVLQAAVGYSQIWANGSLWIRAGELPSAFGSFLLRYSDMDNPLIDSPLAYGYYYRPVTNLGMTAAQVDATWRRLDARVQLANSSPANRRSPWSRDQYANWAAGAGYTIVQGFRIGVSAYRGPYLDRHSPFFFPRESKPKSLPATAYGVDANWARGHTSLSGEWQRFIMTYHAIPTFTEQSGYAEVKQVLHPRWFVAGRGGYLNTSFSSTQAFEAAIGFRPAGQQLFKAGYQLQRNARTGQLDHIVGLQYVAAVHPFVWAGR